GAILGPVRGPIWLWVDWNLLGHFRTKPSKVADFCRFVDVLGCLEMGKMVPEEDSKRSHNMLKIRAFSPP
ncbi:hypothetical protein, partial [Bacillus subtilis]|uniref:hypothetical protein n=1 Tax=Bacillus subtilis TaxID=1423 RepID=UPI0028A0DD21